MGPPGPRPLPEVKAMQGEINDACHTAGIGCPILGVTVLSLRRRRPAGTLKEALAFGSINKPPTNDDGFS
jgi:hypothetical protein